MTIPAECVHSVSDWLFFVVDELRELPHVKKLTKITALWISLNEQRSQNLGQGQEDLGLQSLRSLQYAPPNARRLAAKCKNSRVRLLFEPLTIVEDLRNTFIFIRKQCDQLQLSSKDQILEQLDEVIEDLHDGGACIELNSAESEFKNLLFKFLRDKRSKSDTSEDSISVSSWLGEQLGTDADSIKQELEEVMANEGSYVEVLLFYIAELEERKFTSCRVSSSDANSEERIFDKTVDEVSHSAFQAPDCDEPLNEVALTAVENLRATGLHWVLTGFAELTRCTKLANGKLAVHEANAIPEAIRLAQENSGLYTPHAMTLLEALTSSHGVGEGGVRSNAHPIIYLHISDHLDFLIDLMKNKRDRESSLLAAETVVNMLVNLQVWHAVRIKHDIVSALVAISNEDTADQSIHEWNRADRVCLLGLNRLKKHSPGRIELERKSAGAKTQIMVTALMKLLSDGLKETVLSNLAEDTLVTLDKQVLVMGRRTPTLEIWLEFRRQLLNLMVTDDLISHTSFPGRMAILSLMGKLCDVYKEGVTEGLFLYLLKMIKATLVQLSDPGKNEQEGNDLKQILDLSLKVFCLCVTHGKDTAQDVFTRYVAERKTLEVMLEDSGILDESKLEILEIFDKIDMQSNTHSPTGIGEVAVLVKLAKSPSRACRAQAASRLLKFVQEMPDETEMEEAGGIDALMGLLTEEQVDCQRDALLALYRLSPSITIQTDKLPYEIILGFLHPEWPSDVRDAAVGFLDLMVKGSTTNAKKFIETPGALKAVLNCLDIDAENPSCQKSLSALLIMATEVDEGVRFGIANAGLGILVNFVQGFGSIEHKKLLTIMLDLLCNSGTGFEELVIKANGHAFLLTSLRERISMDTAAQALLSLVSNVKTRGDVLLAGFVEKAMKIIDSGFASTEMAVGLAIVCSTPDGLDQIVDCSRSLGALLILLERCPTFDGKGAAATVLAELYRRLNFNEDLQSAKADACSHILIGYLHDEDRSQLQVFLKALAAFATRKEGRITIHEGHAEEPLIGFLNDREIGSEVRDLVLKILAEMSSVFPEGVTTQDSSYHKILSVFLDYEIGDALCLLHKNEEFRKNTESMKNLLILIRNLSLAGPGACSHLFDAGALNLLLTVLSNHDKSSSPVTELAVKALVKFMDDADCRREFPSSGIRSLVSILKLDARPCDVRSIAIIILASVAQDPRTGGAACTEIFNCGILGALNKIIYEGETSRIKWQAGVLLRLLAMNGPTRQVCAAIFKANTLEALRYLRDQRHCNDIANDVLNFVKGRNSDCRRRIDSWGVR